jgi:hypothetical protein
MSGSYCLDACPVVSHAPPSAMARMAETGRGVADLPRQTNEAR